MEQLLFYELKQIKTYSNIWRIFLPRCCSFKASAHSLCIAGDPLTSLGQIHSWRELRSNQQDSHDLQWIMILMSGAKLVRDCSHHLGQSCFSFWLQGRQGAFPCSVSGINGYTPWYITLPKGTENMCLNARVHRTAGTAHVHIDLFQSVHSKTTQPLLRESEFSGAIGLYLSELPFLLILPFLVTNASLTFKTAPFWSKSNAVAV